jgi:hypothetical protein
MIGRAAAVWLALNIGLASAGAAQPLPAAAESQPGANAPAEAAPAPDTNAPAEATPEGSGDAAADQPPPIPVNANVLINWVIATHDNGDLPFMVIDKDAAEVFVYDADGQSLGRAPVLIGEAKGDDSVPGVGDRELSNIAPEDRTTPAGRFVAKMGPASGHKRVLWVDYGDAISLHPVITSNKKEHRLQRLNSPTPDDNRITYGCINVPTAFYHKVVAPLVKDTNSVVYILPDTRPLKEVFAAVPFPNPPAQAIATSQ